MNPKAHKPLVGLGSSSATSSPGQSSPQAEAVAFFNRVISVYCCHYHCFSHYCYVLLGIIGMMQGFSGSRVACTELQALDLRLERPKPLNALSP